VHQDNPDVNIQELSPWLDLRVPPKEVKIAALDAQTHRRVIKTHLPVDALTWHPNVKYVYVARDGRDVAWSLYNHYINANDEWYGVMNDTPGRVGPPIPKIPKDYDVMQFYEKWYTTGRIGSAVSNASHHALVQQPMDATSRDVCTGHCTPTDAVARLCNQDQRGWAALLVVLGQCQDMVGRAQPAQRDVFAL